MKFHSSLLYASALFPFFLASPAGAKSTFLPDWQQAGLTFGVDVKGDQNKDENYCKEAVGPDGSKFYHKASGCTRPKIFDETCPTDPGYISKCYCPVIYDKTCSSPYKGDVRVTDKGYASCDGKYIACCNATCSAGEVGKSCSGTDIRYVAGSNGCGETCYACRPCRNDCNTSCGYNQDAHATGSYSECGQACVTCTDRCSPYGDESGCSCGTYSCSDGCGGTRTCCSSCPTPSGSSGGSSGSSGGSSGGPSGPKTGRIWFEPTNKWTCWNANTSTQCSKARPYAMVQDVHEWCDCGGGIHEYDRGMHQGYKSSDCYATLAECNAGTFQPKTDGYLPSARCTCN